MSCQLIDTNGFHVKKENERITTAGSHCRQNLKFETSRRRLADSSKNCSTERVARSARSFFLVRPITLLISLTSLVLNGWYFRLGF